MVDEANANALKWYIFIKLKPKHLCLVNTLDVFLSPMAEIMLNEHGDPQYLKSFWC